MVDVAYPKKLSEILNVPSLNTLYVYPPLSMC